MNLTYNSFDIAAVGDVRISQKREFTGGNDGTAPQRAHVALKVIVDVDEDGYADNAAALKALREALRTQHGLLVWSDTDTGDIYVSQTATVTGVDQDEEWGTWTQSAEFTFHYDEALVTSNEVFTVVVGGQTFALQHVARWHDEFQQDLAHPARATRRQPVLRHRLGGFIFPDPAASLADRRTALLAERTRWKAGLTAGAEASIAVGAGTPFTVRIESFAMELNQHADRLEWSLEAVSTLFDKDTYALVDYAVAERDGSSLELSGTTAESFLVVTGKVMAATEAQALARLQALRGPTLTAYGYEVSQTLRSEISPAKISSILDGDTFIETTFTLEYRKERTDAWQCTLTKAGGTAATPLGTVTHFAHRYAASRFSEQRSQRRHAGGTVSLRGVIYASNIAAPNSAGLTQRRAVLINYVNAMRAACNGADGILNYGGGAAFNERVRVEEFTAELNQALTAIEWSMTASYSLFPNETGYATVEFTVTPRTSAEDGEEFITFSGRIQAQSEAAARSKLAGVQNTVLAAQGFTAAQQLRNESSAQSVFANGDKTAPGSIPQAADGTTFIELTFTQEYRKRKTSGESWTLTVSTADDVRSGFVITTYAGTVTAPSYAAAVARAGVLGGSKLPFILRSTISQQQRKTTTGAAEFVTLEFSYEYQQRGARIYYEVQQETVTAAFGTDALRISGFIIAPDLSQAQAQYDILKGELVAEPRRIREETVTHGQQALADQAVSVPPLSYLVPGDAQFTRLDFALTLFVPKAAAVAIRYSIEVARDYLTLEQTAAVSGSCWARNEQTATEAVDGLLDTLEAGQVVRDSRTAQHERMNLSGTPDPGDLDDVTQVDFSAQFARRLTGIEGVLTCEVTEEIEFSSTRWVAQALPRNTAGGGGVSVMQDCGVEPGRRRISGRVVAAVEGTAYAWANTQRSLLTGDADGGSYEVGATRSGRFIFAPREEGVARGADANLQVFELSFTFGEILPNYPYIPSSPPLFSPASLSTGLRQGYVQHPVSLLWHKLLIKTTEDNVVVLYADSVGVP